MKNHTLGQEDLISETSEGDPLLDYRYNDEVHRKNFFDKKSRAAKQGIEHENEGRQDNLTSIGRSHINLSNVSSAQKSIIYHIPNMNKRTAERNKDNYNRANDSFNKYSPSPYHR